MSIDLKDWLPLDYVPQQAALWNSPARFVCVVAPRQSGKSLLCRRACRVGRRGNWCGGERVSASKAATARLIRAIRSASSFFGSQKLLVLGAEQVFTLETHSKIVRGKSCSRSEDYEIRRNLPYLSAVLVLRNVRKETHFVLASEALCPVR